MATLPDFKAFTPPGRGSIATSGQRSICKRMLGELGATAIGKGAWIECEGVTWKAFLLRGADQGEAFPAAAVVEIQACNELDPVEPVTNSHFIVLATLNAANPQFSLEPPFAYIRAVVTTPGAAACQVDMNAVSI